MRNARFESQGANLDGTREEQRNIKRDDAVW
jgi:hypothetical protein